MSVATTYADALYEAAEDAGLVGRVAEELGAFRDAMRDVPELSHTLLSPEVDTRAKKGTVAALTGDANPLVANFLQVLLDRGRIEELPEIAEAFEERVAQAAGRLEVEAVTAVPLDDDLRARIVQRIESQTGRAVDLSESVDPGIIGGIVLRVGGVLIDASVRERLTELRRTLTSTPVANAVEPGAEPAPAP